MSKEERIQPVKIIIPKTEKSLRNLLKENNVLIQVKNGHRIVLMEGKSLTDLDQVIPLGKKIIVISFSALGGG